MRLSVGIVALALASSSFAMPIVKREAIQEFGNGVKVTADAFGVTDAHNAVDAYFQGNLKAFENNSGLTEASEHVGLQPFGKPITKRDAVQDVGKGLKILSDNSGATDLHNAVDAYFAGNLKAFENNSGLTEASEGVGFQPYGKPITKRDAIQDVGKGLKVLSDNSGATDLHNAVDAYFEGNLKAFENNSGLTEASEGVDFQPYGKPITKRDAVQDVGKGFKVLSDNSGATDLHNAVDAYFEGNLKAFENESGLTEASEGVGFQPYGKPITKRDAVQDVGKGFKVLSDNSGATDLHNAVDAYFEGNLKAFENNSGLTEASEGVDFQPYGKPITKREA